MARFEYWQGKDGQWYWRLKARNGRTLCHSEGYSSRAKCLHGIDAAVGAVLRSSAVREVTT